MNTKMDNFKQQIEELQRITNELDAYIWSIFGKYVEQEKILFSSPKGWEVDGNTIHFHGSDGCMGCYDSMSLNIPVRFFINPDTEFQKLAEQRKKEQNDKAEKERKSKESYELKELERLESKYRGPTTINPHLCG